MEPRRSEQTSNPELDEGERSQISGHIDLPPAQRLHRLLDLLAFEERARRATVVRKLRE